MNQSQTLYLYINLSKKSLRVGLLQYVVLSRTKTLSKITNNYTHETHFYRIFSRLRFGTSIQNSLLQGAGADPTTLLLVLCSMLYIFCRAFSRLIHASMHYNASGCTYNICSNISGCLIKIDFSNDIVIGNDDVEIMGFLILNHGLT